MKGKTWFRVRMGLMAFAFIALLAAPPAQFRELRKMSSWMLWTMGIVGLVGILAMPLLLQLLLALQAVNPFSDKTWTCPTHHSNPFHFGNPLLFFHFGAYVIAAGSLGTLLSAAWNGIPALLFGIGQLVGALSVLLGVRLAMRLFKRKMATQDAA